MKAQQENIDVSFSVRIPKIEVDQFKHFYKETDGCACADSLGAMYHYLKDETSWDREKTKRFLVCFALKGLHEEWLLSEMGF